MVFLRRFDTPYARMVPHRAPSETCGYHRVWFHLRTLDKGTLDWWLPWWEDDDGPVLVPRNRHEQKPNQLCPVQEVTWSGFRR